jgi:hypothetical protein
MTEFTGRKLLKGKKRMARPRIIRSEKEREAERRSFNLRRYGSLGAASPVRKIDPGTGQVIKEIPARKA